LRVCFGFGIQRYLKVLAANHRNHQEDNPWLAAEISLIHVTMSSAGKSVLFWPLRPLQVTFSEGPRQL
jgi:hypothetical protein